MDGLFIENAGQKGEHWGALYAQGESCIASFDVRGWSITFFDELTSRCVRVDIGFEDSRPVVPVGEAPQVTEMNFLMGSDPTGWVTGARTFREVWYRGLWDGIDLRFCHVEGRLKYEFHLKPNVDPTQIRMTYEGPVDLAVLGNGDLVVRTRAGSLLDEAPVAFQDGPAGRRAIGCAFILEGPRCLCFRVGEFDGGLPLVIDPGFGFGTYYGGTAQDCCYAMTIGEDDSVYIGGLTYSRDLPISSKTWDRYYYDRGDCFIAKFDPNASTLLFATFIGHEYHDEIRDLAIDGDGHIVAIGETYSRYFPTTLDALKRRRPYSESGSDGFFLRLNASGRRLEYSTYIGGTGREVLRGLCVDGQGNTYLAGLTDSTDFPTTQGAHCTTHTDEHDLFVMKWFPNNTLLWSTYIGGSGHDELWSDTITVDDSGNVYCVGRTGSADFPTTAGAIDTSLDGAVDCVVVKFGGDGTLLFSTYFGGTSEDQPRCLETDGSGRVWYSGFTDSSDLPVTDDAYQKDKTYTGTGLGSSFLARLSDDGASVEYCSYFGTEGSTSIFGFYFDDDDRITMVGKENKHLLELPKGTMYKPRRDKDDVFVVQLNISAGLMLNGTFLKMEHVGHVRAGCEENSEGTTVVAGYTASDDLMTSSGCYQAQRNGSNDAFVQALTFGETNLSLPGPPTQLIVTGEPDDWVLHWATPDQLIWPIRYYSVFMGTEKDNLSLLGYAEDGWPNRNIRIPDTEDYVPLYFGVTATTMVGEGNMSETLEFIPFRYPTVPLNLRATEGNGSVLLEWDPPEDDGGTRILGYKVFRMAPGGDYVLYHTVYDGTSYLDTNVTNGEIYRYHLRAFHYLAESETTPCVEATPAGTPSGPFLHASLEGDDVVMLEWTPPSFNGGATLTGYRLYRGFLEQELDLFYELPDPYTNYLNDRDVVENETYFYAISALNRIGEGELSPTVEATIVGPPSPPRNLTAVAGHQRVHLDWEAPESDGASPVTGYDLFRGYSALYMEPHRRGLKRSEYTDTELTNNVTYYYQVVAYNERRYGTRSEMVTATPLGLPGAVRSLMVEEGPYSLSLSWEPPLRKDEPAPDRYEIHRGTSPERQPFIREVDGDVLEFEDTGIQPLQVYFYHVVAVSPEGGGPASAVVSGTAFRTPGSPQNLSVVAGPSKVTIGWDQPLFDGGRPIVSYWLLRGLTPDGLEVLVEVKLPQAYIDLDVENNMTYFYAVYATNEAGTGDRTRIDHATPRPEVTRPGRPLDVDVWLEGTDVGVKWKAPDYDGGSEIITYVVYRGTSPAAMTPVAFVGNALRYVDRGMDEGTKYFYSVAAENELGEGPRSPVVDIEVEGEGTDDAPGDDGGLLPVLIAAAAVAIVLLTVSLAVWRRRGRAGGGHRGP